MDKRRVAALLRELADAIEAPEPAKRSRKRVAAPAVEVSPAAKAAAQRALKKAGIAA